jgi:hypothetical protein
MRPWFWTILNLLAAAACGAGAAALTSQSGEVSVRAEAPAASAAPAPAQVDSDDLESLAAQIRELRSALSAVEQTIARPQPPSQRAERGPLAPSASLEETTGRLDRWLAQESQTADDRRFESELQGRFLDMLPRGASLRGLSCRASMCKLDVVYPDFASYQQFIGLHVGSDTPFWTDPMVIDVPEDAGPTSVNLGVALYLARRAELFQ